MPLLIAKSNASKFLRASLALSQVKSPNDFKDFLFTKILDQSSSFIGGYLHASHVMFSYSKSSLAKVFMLQIMFQALYRRSCKYLYVFVLCMCVCVASFHNIYLYFSSVVYGQLLIKMEKNIGDNRVR